MEKDWNFDTLPLGKSIVNIAKNLEPNDFKDFMMAIFNYGYEGVETDLENPLLDAILKQCEYGIEAMNNKRVQNQSNIAKRWNKKKEVVKEEPVTEENTEENTNFIPNEYESDTNSIPNEYEVDTKRIPNNNNNNNDNSNNNIYKRKNNKKETAHRYGEFKHVLLTDSQYQKLFDSIPYLDSWIKKLDEYLENNPSKHYANHMLVIRQWYARENPKIQDSKAPPGNTNAPNERLLTPEEIAEANKPVVVNGRLI